MSPANNRVGKGKMIRSNGGKFHDPYHRRARVGMRIACLVLSLMAVCAGAWAQVPLTGSSPASSGQGASDPLGTTAAGGGSRTDDTDRDLTASGIGLRATSPQTLPTSRILEMLQSNPDLIIELKSLVADRLRQQGADIDENSISDQALFDQIANSASLRLAITTYLRARGYITADDPDLEEPIATDALIPGGARQTSALGAMGQLPLDVTQAGVTDGRETLADMQGLSSAQRPGVVAGNKGQTARGSANVHASTDPPRALHEPTPYNLRAMRDLYTQIPDQMAELTRFGSEVFVVRSAARSGHAASEQITPLDVPLGPDYVIGPGDALQLQLWGSVTQNLALMVGPDGRVLLPEAGSVSVAGLSLKQAQDAISAAIKAQYRNEQAAVTVSRIHSVRVYVTGDVRRPGAYEISALGTVLSALYAAGGPTAAGSLRVARHMRGEKLIEECDLYDYLLHGVRNGVARFESGDTLFVPPAGMQAAISGSVKRPAIYEMRSGQDSLAALIDDAGGLTAEASLGHIVIERIDPNRQRETVTLPASNDAAAANTQGFRGFAMKDGDRVRVEPILPYSQRAIYLEGHVARPGRIPFVDGMHIGDVLHGYRDLLPEPAARGEIVRLAPPDLHAETIEFNVPDVLGGNARIALEPYDTIRIFGRYEVDAPKVAIRGEVLRPGSYPLSEGMTAAQLVRMAGGFKRDALLERADLTSYTINGENRIVEELKDVRIGAAVAGTDGSADVPLRAGDTLSVHQITGWNDIGESVTVEGQVRFPGSYGFKDGERLSAVLRRAGGLLDTAYPAGAVLIRDQVRELEEKSRDELIRQIETNSASARLSPNLGGNDTAATLQLIKAQQEQVLADLRNHPPTGRMVIRVSADIESWANTPADIELRRGDQLTIPKRPGFVLVSGQVYNSTALTYAPNKTAGWYLSRAGGTNSTANRREIFIIRANGSVIGRRSDGWLGGNVLSTRLDPGDVVVVPQKIMGSSLLWRNLLTTAQLASSIAITAAVAAL